MSDEKLWEEKSFTSRNKGFIYIISRRFQSDNFERSFTQYLWLSGGRFYVSLQEVKQQICSYCSFARIKDKIGLSKENIFIKNPFFSNQIANRKRKQ